MNLKIFQIDAFTDKIFGGNPAAVCPLHEPIADALMQQIAEENNLSETAFFMPIGDDFSLRWFTPTVEVDLCGHATLATAHVLWQHLGYKNAIISFHTRSGILQVSKAPDGSYALNFPTDKLRPAPEALQQIADAIGMMPLEVYKGISDYMAVLGSQAEVESLSPNFALVGKLESRGLIVTAKGDDVDFVSRFFAPQSGIDEDPVTGSAHTTLTPYWSGKIGKTALIATQVSKRKGALQCQNLGERTEIRGQAKTYLVGELCH